MRVKLDTVSGDPSKMMAEAEKRIAKAATDAMREAADLAKLRGRAAIASGGLSKKWQNALRTKVYPQSGVSMSPAAVVYHKIPYAGVFQKGATISGKPLLWLPIEQNLPVQARGKRWTPRDFVNTIGPLRSVNLPGKPPLLVAEVRVGRSGSVLSLPGNRSNRRVTSFARAKQKLLPVFVGVRSVTDPKKFDIDGIVADVSARLGDLYAKHFRSA